MKVEENSPLYSGKKLRFFSRFEEENDRVHQNYVRMAPEEWLNEMYAAFYCIAQGPD